MWTDGRTDMMKAIVNLLNPLKAELNPIRHLLALAGAHHFVHVSRLRVNFANAPEHRRSISCSHLF